VRLAFREAVRSFRRAPTLSLLAVTTIAFALFVMSLFTLVALNLRAALTELEERVEVVVYLRRGTPIEVVTVAMDDIMAFPEVEDVSYVSEEQALSRARAELREFQDVYGELETNPLPASLEIRLQPGFRTGRHTDSVAQRIQGFRFVDDVDIGREWVEKLDRLRSIAGALVFLVGAAFAAASIIIIGTTIRMTVLQRSREIALMRLVGATSGFIRLPFLLDGVFKGALGGLLALGLSWAAYAVVTQRLIQGRFFSPGESALVVLFGIAFGLLASVVSVGRHLREV
jgi:cell division transport system permease protein